MDEIRPRLEKCFALVFPSLPARQFASASTANLAAWDSVAQINLLTLIGEEFGIEVDYEKFEDATSFEALADRIAKSSA